MKLARSLTCLSILLVTAARRLDACQVQTWNELVAQVASSVGTFGNPIFITLCPGTYTVHTSSVDLSGKFVHIECVGTDSTEGCVIDGESAINTPAFETYSSGAFEASLKHLTFKNFGLSSYPAVSVSEGGFLAIWECTFTNNPSAEGSVVLGKGTLDIQDCLFKSSNRAVTVSPVAGNTAVATISNSVFKDNTGAYNGGAVGCNGSGASCELTSSTFEGNQATYKGGAIYCYNGAVCSIFDSIFLKNGAPAGGNNIYCETGCACYDDQCKFYSEGGVSK